MGTGNMLDREVEGVKTAEDLYTMKRGEVSDFFLISGREQFFSGVFYQWKH